ncbi:ATP-binding cassette domain-containing protein [Streptomyces eurocidicus]|nr:ABC transporter ATP-binding protein [Streptomyces eurocidicus]MBB5120278.1 ABC-type multidrug transport system fused ATPase/permease subunit [Streptomyces eurocidicus]MBF6056042.1 ATP-binding cassette domain-containing protein [Streptomyces eurocidicus]
MATMLARALVPVVIGLAIDRGLVAHDRPSLWLWSGVLFALVVLQAATTTLQERCDFAVNAGPSFRTMQYVNRHAAVLGADLRKHTSTGEVVNIGTGDIEPIGRALAATSRAAGAVVAIVVVAAVMLSSAWQLGLTVLIGVPLIVWLMTLAVRPLRRRQGALRKQQGELAAFAVDTATGLGVLHGFGGAERFAERYRAESQRTRRLATRTARTEGALAAVKTFLPGALGTAVVWLGAHLVLDGTLTVGQLVAFYGYAVFLATPLRWLTESFEALTRGHVSAERVCRFLRAERELPDGTAGTTGDTPAPAGPLHDPLSRLSVTPGAFTAVACASPADATVLADRLGRYADSGTTWGDVPLGDRPLAETRERVLVLRNDDRLFAGPLHAELDPLGRTTREDLLELADTAVAREVLDALPDGLDSQVQGAGRNFSGGERQRLRLVRALAADPEVLLLVEPTSALDTHTEARLVQRLRARRDGRTTVVFTSSPAVLSQADHVVHVEDTTAVATGSHRELLADDRYHSLVTREGDPT